VAPQFEQLGDYPILAFTDRLRRCARAHAPAAPESHAEVWAAFGRAMPDYDVRKARLRLSGPELEW